MGEIEEQFDFNFSFVDNHYEGETKVSNKCDKELPLSCFGFHSASNYLRPECKKCNNKLAKLRKQLKEIYGIPLLGYLCPICGGSEEEVKGKGNKLNGAWVLDHCHEEDTFRGWLCHKCNRGIGCFNDNVNRLINATNYLTPNKIFKQMKTYKIKITDEQGNTNILEITSTDIEWSMKQYQRHRTPLTWEIQEEKDNL